MSFLPEGYKTPSAASNYFKLVKGDNRFRILGEAIVGWEVWDKRDPKNTKVIRSRTPITEWSDQNEKVKIFWAFPVYDYQSEEVKVFTPTQGTIQRPIENLSLDADWGDPKNYDICIKRTGDGMETEYSLVPIPPKPLRADIAKLYAEKYINLEALYDGGDPFSKGEKAQSDPDNSDPQFFHETPRDTYE